MTQNDLYKRLFNYQLVYAKYDKTTGISEVMINPHSGGSFIGRAKCHPDEADKSSYFGCEIAERRATLNYFRVIYAEYKNFLKTLQTLLTEMPYSKKLKRAVAAIEADVEMIKEELARYKEGIANMDKYRIALFEKINKRRQK